MDKRVLDIGDGPSLLRATRRRSARFWGVPNAARRLAIVIAEEKQLVHGVLICIASLV
jgi:hypothetical protein